MTGTRGHVMSHLRDATTHVESRDSSGRATDSEIPNLIRLRPPCDDRCSLHFFSD